MQISAQQKRSAGEHFSSPQIKNTCLNVNVEIITLNVVILSCPWRNISMIQWLVFLFSCENLQIFRLYINTFHLCPKIETEVADPLSGS